MKLKSAAKFDAKLERGLCQVTAALVGTAVVGAYSASRSGRTSTTTTTPPPMTDAEREAEQLRLAELRRQNDIAERMLPNQTALIEQQRQLIQYQMDHQHDMDALHAQQLRLAELQVQQQISDAALQEQLRPQQLEFLHNSNQLALQQIASLTETTGFQREQNRFILAQMQDTARRTAARNAAYSPEEEAQAAAEEARRATRMGAISEQAANIQLENLRRGTKPTDEQLANINEAYDASQRTGESDIRQFLLDTQHQINNETSQAAGLRPTDTPVVRLSERAGEEAARQQGQLTRSVEGGRATARLNYPLAASQLAGNQAATLQNLTGTAADFQSRLRMAAAANRDQAFQSPGSASFAMPQSGPSPNLAFMSPGSPGYNPNSFNLNFFRGGGTTTQTGPFNMQQAGQFAGGVGSLMSGYARLYGGS